MMLIRVLGESIHFVKTDKEAVLVAGKDVGLERNADNSVNGRVCRPGCKTKSQRKDRE